MIFLASLLVDFIIPVAVIISAAATTAMAGIAIMLYRSTALHDRVIFGDEDLNFPGLLRMVESHRDVIEEEHGVSLDQYYTD